MRELAHLLSVVLVVPSLAFASMFAALGHVTSATGFLAFLLAILESIVVLLPWLLACLALLIVLALLGFSARYRWAAAICVAGIAIGSTGVLVWLDNRTLTAGDAAFHVPAAVAVVIALWLAVSEWPRGPKSAAAGTATPVQ